MRRTITIDVEIDRPYENAEQERYVLATIEEALTEQAIWFDLLCNEASAPQKFKSANARFKRRSM